MILDPQSTSVHCLRMLGACGAVMLHGMLESLPWEDSHGSQPIPGDP